MIFLVALWVFIANLHNGFWVAVINAGVWYGILSILGFILSLIFGAGVLGIAGLVTLWEKITGKNKVTESSEYSGTYLADTDDK